MEERCQNYRYCKETFDRCEDGYCGRCGLGNYDVRGNGYCSDYMEKPDESKKSCRDCIYHSLINEKHYCDIGEDYAVKYIDCRICADFKQKDIRNLAKQDAGKLRISIVPPEIIRAIAKVREYGIEKYGDSENWRTVEISRYWDAMLRHTLTCFGDLGAKDEESGFPHLWHVACNLAFILELMEEEDE